MGKAQTGLKRTMQGTFPNLKKWTTLQYNALHYNLINLSSITKQGPRTCHFNVINRINNATLRPTILVL